MSFGLSPGDVVLFGQFVGKVIASLKEAGGSKSEFQLAERQCQGFLLIMNELQSLELNNVPESFRTKLKEYSTDLEEFVKDFRKSIAHYEKSMGENSERGIFRSSPRKVQWALLAADGLNKFRQSHASQLDLVKIVIHMSMLSIVNNNSAPRPILPQPGQSLALTRRPSQHANGTQDHGAQGFIEWNTNPIVGTDFFRRVDDLTDLVYERFRNRSRVPLQTSGRVHTSHYESSIDIHQKNILNMPERQTLQVSTASAQPTDPIQQEGTMGDEESFHDTLADEIDEYLLSLNLNGLSDQERHNVAQDSSYSRLLLLDGPHSGATEAQLQDTEGTAEEQWSLNAQADAPKRSRANKKFFKFRRFEVFESVGLNYLTPLAMTASVIGLVDATARASFQLSDFYNTVRAAPRQVKILSNRLMQYSSFLRIAAETIRSSMPAGELQDLGWEILKDSKETLLQVDEIIADFQTTPGHQIIRALKWQSNKKDVVAVMEEVESLKSTLSIMLQLYQVKAAEDRRDFEGVTKAGISRDVLDKFQHRSTDEIKFKPQ